MGEKTWKCVLSKLETGTKPIKKKACVRVEKLRGMFQYKTAETAKTANAKDAKKVEKLRRMFQSKTAKQKHVPMKNAKHLWWRNVEMRLN